MKTWRLTDIQWETDGEEVFLPDVIEIRAQHASDAVDLASDRYGFLILEASVELV